jgi:DnaA family protein
MVHKLELLAESETISAIQLHANSRGFDLPDDCAKYLIRRVQRDVSSLVEIIQLLDYESLSKKRILTIPFIKSILNLG